MARERALFLSRNPERVTVVRGRRWGVIGVPLLKDPVVRPSVLVLLPGTVGRADIFWRVMERLEGRTRLLALSYPANHDVRAWAGDVIALLDRFELERVHLLGSSLGGYLAQWLVGGDGDRWAGLIAANTLPGVEMVRTVPPYAGDLERVPIADVRAGFRLGLGRWADEHPEHAEMVELLLAEVAGRIPARHLRARLLALKHGPVLPAPNLPSCRIAVIESDDDPLLPEPIRRATGERLEPSVTYRFAHGGHFPYIARPDLYADAVADRLGLGSAGGWGDGSLRIR